MQFSKKTKKYYDKELLGNVSNYFKFTIKDLYKIQNSQELPLCKNCQSVIYNQQCLFCGFQNQLPNIQSSSCRNVKYIKEYEQGQKIIESMILCVDISGSMNCTYRSHYKKINKQYAIRVIGKKNFDKLAKIIDQKHVVKNLNSIQSYLDLNQSIQDIGHALKAQIDKTIKNQNKLDKQQNQNQNKISQENQQKQYISRKQIIQVGVAKYIETIKNKKPNTLITIVYFNENISVPIDNFKDKLIISDIQNKNIQEMIALGKQYASLISILPVQDVGENLTKNMMETQANGQTALGPCLAFCIGLAKSFQHELHQIVVVTDGLANVGFGQTQKQSDLIDSKKLYQNLAQQYAIKQKCVINVIGFEDSAIGYQVIDEIVKRTNGLPYQISTVQQKQQKVVNKQTIDFLNFQIMTGFSQASKQFCYDTKISILVNNPAIKIIPPKQFIKFIKKQNNNFISLQLGIRSISQNIQFQFILQKQQFEQQYLKITLLNQYKRKNKKYYTIRQQLISILKGNQQQAEKQQSQVLQKQMKQKLQFHKIVQQNYQQYDLIQKKLQKASLANKIDQKILNRFQEKKKIVQQYQKNSDKLTRDKKRMETRRNQTYKNRKGSSDDQPTNSFM